MDRPLTPWRNQLLPLERWLRERRASEWLPGEMPMRLPGRRRVHTPAEAEAALDEGWRALELCLPPEGEAALQSMHAWLGAMRNFPPRLSISLSSPHGCDTPASLLKLAESLGPMPPFEAWCWGGQLGAGWPRQLLAIFAEWPQRPPFRAWLPPHEEPIDYARKIIDMGFSGLWARLDEHYGDTLVAVRCWLGARVEREPLGRFGLCVSTETCDPETLMADAGAAATLGLDELIAAAPRLPAIELEAGALPTAPPRTLPRRKMRLP